jgi:hypothetical protein
MSSLFTASAIRGARAGRHAIWKVLGQTWGCTDALQTAMPCTLRYYCCSDSTLLLCFACMRVASASSTLQVCTIGQHDSGTMPCHTTWMCACGGDLITKGIHAMHLHMIHEALQNCSARTALPLDWPPASTSASAASHSIAATPRRSHSDCRHRPRRLRDHV